MSNVWSGKRSFHQASGPYQPGLQYLPSSKGEPSPELNYVMQWSIDCATNEVGILGPLESTNPGLGNLMTNAAQITSERQLCHDPEGGAMRQSLVGDRCGTFAF
jgi:hypothetical protein